MLAGLIKKELAEIIKTNKALPLLVIFLIIGFSSPITAEFMPKIISRLASSFPGAVFMLPKPTPLDACHQLAKNLYQIAMVVVILIGMNSIVEERTNGSLSLLFTKPVHPLKYILGKYIAYGLLLLTAILISFIACAAYTKFIFDDALLPGYLRSGPIIVADYLALLAVVVFWSSATARTGSSALASFLSYTVIAFFSFIFQEVNLIPAYHQNAVKLGFQHLIFKDTILYIVLVDLLTILFFLYLANFLFKKRDI